MSALISLISYNKRECIVRYKAQHMMCLPHGLCAHHDAHKPTWWRPHDFISGGFSSQTLNVSPSLWTYTYLISRIILLRLQSILLSIHSSSYLLNKRLLTIASQVLAHLVPRRSPWSRFYNYDHLWSIMTIWPIMTKLRHEYINQLAQVFSPNR